jgi:uncharacterized protein (DUF4415 family)
MKKHATKKRSRTNWAKIDALKDREIDTSDIPEQGKAFFKRTMLRLPEPKAAVTIRLDRQVLDWLKTKEPGYQTRIMFSFEPTWKRTKDEARATDWPSCSQNAHDETVLVRCAQ